MPNRQHSRHVQPNGITHNVRKNLAVDAMRSERSDLDHVRWSWSGTGESRALSVTSGGQLTAQQRNRAQSALNIQFGIGKVTVEG